MHQNLSLKQRETFMKSLKLTNINDLVITFNCSRQDALDFVYGLPCEYIDKKITKMLAEYITK